MILSALNIKFKDKRHQTPQNYAELFKFIPRIAGSTRGHDVMCVAYVTEIEQDAPLAGLTGNIYRYTIINPADPWLDEEKMIPVEVTPGNLRPNLKQLGFVFSPRRHKLIFDNAHLSPKIAKTGFENIFSDERVMQKFGAIEVHVIASKSAVEEIIEQPKKTKLHIKISLPNPDDLSELEDEITERLQNKNAEQLEIIQKTKDQDGLILDDEDKALINLSASNGSTILEAKKDGKKVMLATTDTPRKERGSYIPAQQDYLSAVWENATELYGPI